MRLTFDAIGTSWEIDINDPIAQEDADRILRDISARIDAFDRNYSRFRGDSLVAEMSRREGTYALPDDAAPMLALYEACFRLTDGAMTPLIGNVLSDAGYDAQYSLTPKPLTAPPAWDDALEFRAATDELVVKTPALLDFGAMGKGYLIDIVAELLRANGARSFVVDAGGDIIQRSAEKKVLRVGLEDPTDFGSAVGVAHIVNQSICGSAGNRRKWADFHHIINPHTLASPTHLQAVWTVAKTTMLADAMSTALFFAPPEVLRARFAFEYLLVHEDRTIAKSSAFPAEMFR